MAGEKRILIRIPCRMLLDVNDLYSQRRSRASSTGRICLQKSRLETVRNIISGYQEMAVLNSSLAEEWTKADMTEQFFPTMLAVTEQE